MNNLRIVGAAAVCALLLGGCGTPGPVVSGSGSASSVASLGDLAWSAPVQIDPANVMASVSCPTSDFCAAVGSRGSASTFDGHRWTTPKEIDPHEALDAVSCASPTFCVAGGERGSVLRFNGTSWSDPVSLTGPNSFESVSSVSCTSTTSCVAVSEFGSAFTYDGQQWSPGTSVNVGDGDGLHAVSCASASFCLAGGYGAIRLFAFNGAGWRPVVAATETAVGDGRIVISCVRGPTCLVASVGTISLYSGSQVKVFASSGGFAHDGSDVVDRNTYVGSSGDTLSASITSMTCVTDQSCLAVDNTGHALYLVGDRWLSSPRRSPIPLLSVSCPSTRFCMSVGGDLQDSSNGVALVAHQ